VDPITSTTPPLTAPAEELLGGSAGRPRIERLEVVAVAAGGAVGALTRVGLSQAFPTVTGNWPWATFAVNMAGALLLGCLLAWLRGRDRTSIPLYRLLGTGFCSTATTFSTVQVELLRMLDQGRYGLAGGYIAASVAGGYAAVSMGVLLVRNMRVGR
jgi:CrcB protein